MINILFFLHLLGLLSSVCCQLYSGTSYSFQVGNSATFPPITGQTCIDCQPSNSFLLSGSYSVQVVLLDAMLPTCSVASPLRIFVSIDTTSCNIVGSCSTLGAGTTTWGNSDTIYTPSSTLINFGSQSHGSCWIISDIFVSTAGGRVIAPTTPTVINFPTAGYIFNAITFFTHNTCTPSTIDWSVLVTVEPALSGTVSGTVNIANFPGVQPVNLVDASGVALGLTTRGGDLALNSYIVNSFTSNPLTDPIPTFGAVVSVPISISSMPPIAISSIPQPLEVTTAGAPLSVTLSGINVTVIQEVVGNNLNVSVPVYLAKPLEILPIWGGDVSSYITTYLGSMNPFSSGSTASATGHSNTGAAQSTGGFTGLKQSTAGHIGSTGVTFLSTPAADNLIYQALVDGQTFGVLQGVLALIPLCLLCIYVNKTKCKISDVP